MKFIIGALRFITMCSVFYLTTILSERLLGENLIAAIIGWIVGIIIYFGISIVESIITYEPKQKEIETDDTNE